MGRRGLPHHSLYVNSHKLLHLSESPEVPLVSFLVVSYVCLPQQYIAHFQIAPDGAFIKHTRLNYVSMDSPPRLEQPPKVKFYARVSSRVPFLYLINKQPNLAFLRGRLTSSSDLALSRSSSVQRSFFCGDVIAITSWAPDVVNLVHPECKRYSLSSPDLKQFLVTSL